MGGLDFMGSDIRLDRILGAHISPHSLASVLYSIQRNGIVTIEVDTLPPADVISEFSDFEQTIASQCYFFLRDLLHKHKFHSPTTDKILDVYRSSDWPALVNYALARKAIRLRRDGRRNSLYRALGVLSYLQSFRDNIMTKEDTDKSSSPWAILLTLLSTLFRLPKV